jgi:SNF2 family DNA or RNA helicase
MSKPEQQDEFFIPYDWPCRGIVPADKQKLTTTFMVWNPHSFVLNDPGTGKTLCALWAADFITSQYSRFAVRTLVIAPLSTLNETWKRELATHFMGRRTYAVVHGSTKKRLQELNKKVDVYIMNHDGIKIGAIAAALSRRPDIKVVIIDESTSFSDTGTDRHKFAKEILAQRPYFWLMTGTPTIRGHTAAHGQARLVHPDYTESFTNFRERTTRLLGPHKREPLPHAYDEARKLLQPCIRIPRRDMHDLPPSIPSPYEVPFSAEQKRLYDTLRKEYVAATAGGARITAVHEGVLRLKLLQIACGAVYDVNRHSHLVDAGPRLRLLAELLHGDHKSLVFAPFTSALTVLYHAFREKLNCAMVVGGVSLGARTRIFKEFQEGEKLKVIFADPGTMSHGLTLTRARQTVWYGPTDKAETYVQANYRIDRPGKVGDTYTVQLMGCPVEKEIYKRLENRQSMEGAMMKIIEREGV